ncbi:hypothetical protein HPP92_009028 [Vanilla planifolia]|uniref:Phosphatidylinositol-specific phospholipase C X domain-containing protein n=1 Tax=Vanilla planifolia TaxID=51239 RepID=A0A835R9V4_VANPL|nr:hypothetical protein HPP92_009028 [Vanilla planifolia]
MQQAKKATVAYYLLMDNRSGATSGYLGTEFQESTVRNVVSPLGTCDTPPSVVNSRMSGWMPGVYRGYSDQSDIIGNDDIVGNSSYVVKFEVQAFQNDSSCFESLLLENAHLTIGSIVSYPIVNFVLLDAGRHGLPTVEAGGAPKNHRRRKKDPLRPPVILRGLLSLLRLPPSDRSSWMTSLCPLNKLRLSHIVWPGTHDSATDRIGVPLITRPFAQCQSRSIYSQLAVGVRVLDVRVQQDRRVCHGILTTYLVDHVLSELCRFLDDHPSELVLLEIRTEFGHDDPPNFESFLVDRLADRLVHQDDTVFSRTVAEILPRQIICVWKPRKAPQPGHGGPLWSAGYLQDNWIDTDLPNTKFESNMKHLGDQPPAAERKYSTGWRTPRRRRPITRWIQVFSSDFIDGDFIDACAALTLARFEGKA